MKRLIYVFCLMSLAQCLTAGNMPPRRLFDAEKREGDTRPKPDLAPTSPSIPLRSGEGRVRSKSPGWQPNGIAVCDTANCFLPKIVTDGNSGAIICWTETYRGADSVNNYTDDIYAQRVDSGGNIVWESQGVPVCNLSDSWSSYPAMISDGHGGSIITWEDSRGGLGYTRVFAQRIDSLGNRLWTENGVLVCNQMSGYVDLCTDGHGGAIIAYVDGRDEAITSDNIYAQRIDSAGNPVWAIDGVPVCTADSIQFWPYICSSINSGAVITWQDDYRNNSSTGRDVYAQMLDSLGNTKWFLNGAPLCVKVGLQRGRNPVENLKGGGIVGWWDFGYAPVGLVMNSIDSNGNKLWSDSGVVIEGYNKLITDNIGGVIASCGKDSVNRIDSLGTVQWGSGIALHPSYMGFFDDGCIDKNNGTIVIWDDRRANPNWSDQYVQRVNSDGNIVWETTGVPVCTLQMQYESYPQATYDGLGGALCTWFGRPWHIDAYDGVFAQRIYSDGTSGGVAGYPVSTEIIPKQYIQCSPNPFSSSMKIEYSLDVSQNARLNVYNITGQLVKTLSNAWQSAGVHTIHWDGRNDRGQKVSNGVYLIRSKTDHQMQTIKTTFIQ